MFRKHFPTAALLFLAAGLSLANAQTVLINNTTLNGSFESGSDTIPSSWVPLPLGGATQVNRATATTNAALVHSGTYSLVVGKSGDGLTTQNAALNTGYTIGSADSFALSFWYNGAFNWDTGDQIEFQLFYTSDNTINGTVTSFYSSTVLPTAPGSGSTWQQFSLSGISATTGAAGKTLFVSFSTGVGVSTNEFARVDEVSLSVVPEPATSLLVGASAGWLLLLRSRRRS